MGPSPGQAAEVVIEEVQTYSNWSGEWASAEKDDPKWLGKQLNQNVPAGTRWAGEGTVKSDQDGTDREGWGYCASVGSVKDRYKKGTTHAAKKMHHFARCRHWTR